VGKLSQWRDIAIRAEMLSECRGAGLLSVSIMI
jgi:hypothetical protein